MTISILELNKSIYNFRHKKTNFWLFLFFGSKNEIVNLKFLLNKFISPVQYLYENFWAFSKIEFFVIFRSLFMRMIFRKNSEPIMRRKNLKCCKWARANWCLKFLKCYLMTMGRYREFSPLGNTGSVWETPKNEKILNNVQIGQNILQR